MLIHSKETMCAVNTAAEAAREISLSTPFTGGSHEWGWALVAGTEWEIGVCVQGGRSMGLLKFRWAGGDPIPAHCDLPSPAGWRL